MKAFRNLFFVALAILPMAISCVQDEKPDPEPGPLLTDFFFKDNSVTKSYSFLEYERLFDVELKSNYKGVTVEIPEEYRSCIRISSSSDNMYRVHLYENKGDRERSIEVKFKMEGADHDLTLKIDQVGDDMEGSLRHALLALYNATNKLGWYDKDNWGSSKPVHEWYGISPAYVMYPMAGGDIYEGDVDLWDIELFGNNMKGVIPDEFWNLCTKFRVLNLESNMDLSKSRSIGELYLKGSKAPDSIWHKDLVVLNLGYTGISISLDSKVANSPNLMELNLSRCELNAPLPKELLKLTELRILEMQDACLRGTVPENIGDLKNLEVLNLSFNLNLEGTFPESIYDLSKLQYLKIQDTKIAGTLSSKIRNLKNIEYLSFGMSEMEGIIPEEIGLLTKIFKNGGFVCCGGAHFTNIPEFFRFLHWYNGDWEGWGCFDNNNQLKDGYHITPELINSFSFYNSRDSYRTLPMPKWYKERYGMRCWEVGIYFRSEENHSNPIYDPKYPYANDLQYPADQYYFDETISAWTHPSYDGKAAKHYHVVNGEWTYDENFDWNSPAEVEEWVIGDWYITI